MRRFALVFGMLACVGAGVLGERVVKRFSWDALPGWDGDGDVSVFALEGQSPDRVLSVNNITGEALNVRVLEVPSPGIQSLKYALRGRVRYQSVSGTGVLELRNHFAGGGSYFTRSLANVGPLKSLTGSSDWRPFCLPFQSSAEAGMPERLEVFVSLPGGGAVWLSGLELAEYGPDENPLAVSGGWWSDSAGGWVGGVGGGILGIMGAIVGVLASCGAGRRAVIPLMASVVSVGGVVLIGGLVAVFARQPYHVFFPLLLLGGLSTVIFGANLPAVRRRYRDDELRRMSAMDA